jgi:hypothetical protein
MGENLAIAQVVGRVALANTVDECDRPGLQNRYVLDAKGWAQPVEAEARHTPKGPGTQMYPPVRPPGSAPAPPCTER